MKMILLWGHEHGGRGVWERRLVVLRSHLPHPYDDKVEGHPQLSGPGALDFSLSLSLIQGTWRPYFPSNFRAMNVSLVILMRKGMNQAFLTQKPSLGKDSLGEAMALVLGPLLWSPGQ